MHNNIIFPKISKKDCNKITLIFSCQVIRKKLKNNYKKLSYENFNIYLNVYIKSLLKCSNKSLYIKITKIYGKKFYQYKAWRKINKNNCRHYIRINLSKIITKSDLFKCNLLIMELSSSPHPSGILLLGDLNNYHKPYISFNDLVGKTFANHNTPLDIEDFFTNHYVCPHEPFEYPKNLINITPAINGAINKLTGKYIEIEVHGTKAKLLSGYVCLINVNLILLKNDDDITLVSLDKVSVIHLRENLLEGTAISCALPSNPICNNIPNILNNLKRDGISISLNDDYFSVSSLSIEAIFNDYIITKNTMLPNDTYILFNKYISSIEAIPYDIICKR